MKPLRLAIVYNPKTLILEYLSNEEKKRHLKVKIEDLENVQELAGQIYAQLGEYFSNVPSDKLKKMLEKLKQGKAEPKEDNSKAIDQSQETDEEENFNKLDDDALEEVKQEMDVMFELNRARPGDPDYVHEVSKEFEPTEESEWD